MATGRCSGRRDLRLLFASAIISDSGSWAYNVALLAFVYERTRSLSLVGLSGLVRLVASLLTSPYAGVLVDRLRGRAARWLPRMPDG